MRYQFRQCQEEDRAWAYALKSEAYREVVERQFGPWDEEFQQGLFNARWNPAISQIILVDGVAAGLAAVEERGDQLWLDEIQLTREWCGKGLGSAIIRDFLRQALGGGQPLRLQVLKENRRALNLYLRLKFVVIGETETHFRMEGRKAPASSTKDVSR